MPQKTNVTITAHADGTYDLQAGPNGFSGRSQSELFSGDNFNIQQLIYNLGLSFRIGNFAQPSDKLFLDAINNKQGGLKLQDATYYITSVVANADGTTTIGTAPSATAATLNTVTMAVPDFATDQEDPTNIIPNIASFLRLRGSAGPTLSAADVAAINAQQFWF